MSTLYQRITAHDIFAFLTVIILMISLTIPVHTPDEISAVFVAKPPPGNNTEAVETLLSDNSVSVKVYLIHTFIWYVFVQVLGIMECGLLYMKIRAFHSSASWSYSSVLEHGGACIANTEFWVFISFHHSFLCIFALHTASLSGVISIVVAYVLTLALVCEPNDDCGRPNSQQELYTNRIMLITAAFVLTLYLFFIDEQLHGNSSSMDSDVLTVLPVQLALDGVLLFAHSSINAKIVCAYVTRLLYVVTCNVVMFIWFVV